MPEDSRNLLLLFLAVALCVLAGCSVDRYADDVSNEDERIMRLMVDISCKVGAERLVVSDRPAVPREDDSHASGGHNVQFGIDFGRRIAHRARWPEGKVCPMVRVVDDSQIAAVLSHDNPGWDRFIATFAGAKSLMRISLPVYSADGRHAVVYTTGSCPYTCGGGFYHQLEKTGAGWHIANSVNAWTS